jgi:salicylate synthase
MKRQSNRDRLSYREKSIEINSDPLILTGLLAESNLSKTFLAYENHGNWCIGIGEAATIVTDCQKTTLTTMEGRTQEWKNDIPVEAVQFALAALPIENWRSYGIANFGLARKNHHLSIYDTNEELLRLFVPVYEIRMKGGIALLRAINEEKLVGLSRLMGDLNSSVIEKNRNPFENRIREMPLDVSSVEEYEGECYQNSVAVAVGEISQRNYLKVILSRAIPLPEKVDIVASYISGRKVNTPARSFLMKNNGLEAAGFSPETVVEVDHRGWVSTRPLAGTRSLGTSELRLRQELLSDSKEIHEHAISVQLAFEELLRVCAEGSVRVSEFMDIARRSSVQHLASRVNGRLAKGRNAWHAFHALFPAVTATGIPKKQAIEAIGRLETAPRDLYSGCVMITDADGMMDAALVLRTVFQRGEKAWLHVGAGIVDKSSPPREIEETCEKVRSVSRYLIRVGN